MANDKTAILDTTEIGALRDGVDSSRRKLASFRQNRLAAIRQYVGKNYSEFGTVDKVPIDFLELAVNIYLQYLAAEQARILVTTEPRDLKPLALKLELDTNRLLTRLKFGEIINEIVEHAIFGMGLAKVGLNLDGNVMIGGQWYPFAEPFIAAISLDNWVHDMDASKWTHIKYEGDYFEVPMEEVLANPQYSQEFKDQIAEIDRKGFDEEGREKAEALTIGQGDFNDAYKDDVGLWDIYVPKKGVVLTMSDTNGTDIPGNIVEWKGPKRGPYHKLFFNRVLDNTMPLAPVAVLRDMHELMNNVFRRLGRQAIRQKTVTGVMSGATEDADRIINANDGDMVKMLNPDKTREFKYGGINQESLLFLLQVKQMASEYAGNLDALGGLSRQSETLGQDELLEKNASKRMVSMGNRTIAFTRGIVEDLAWYRWTDPIRDFPVTIKKHGTEIQSQLSVFDRETDFLKFNFNIHPFSMQSQTPQTKLAFIDNIFNKYLAPFADQLAQQGITIDFEALFTLIGKYGNLPELRDILIYANPQQPQPTAEGKSVRQAPNTTRTNIRVGRPGATNQGATNVLSQILAGGNPQKAELAQLNKTG